MNDTGNFHSIELDIAALLEDISSAQQDMLDHLDQKFTALKHRDVTALQDLQKHEEDLLRKLSQCQNRRLELIDNANENEHKGKTLAEITQSLSSENSLNLTQKIKQTEHQNKLLKHQGLTNWILAQRSLVHVTQILEIIATGGKMRPTYEKREMATEPLSIDRRA